MSDKKETTKEDKTVDAPTKKTVEKPAEKIVEEVKEVKRKPKTEFSGKYTKSIGKRKTSVAQVRLYAGGNGDIAVNGKIISEYFHENKIAIVIQPLKLTGKLKEFDISIIVKGGGVNAQAEACRHGITRILIILDEELKPSLKAKGWVTRDSRKVERKKPGLKKARKAPQWSKR